jgi:uncharacterized protein (TIGR03083 family)
MTTIESHTKKAPRLARIDRQVAVGLAETEFARVADLLDGLTPDQWSAQTDCTDWDVRAMAGHMVGMVQMTASLYEMARQQMSAGRRQKRDGGELVDALTALQVEKNAGLSTTQLVDELRRTAPKAVRFRRRAPGIMRGQVVQDGDEWWTFGYLFDVILTRDPFMHRVDISRAAGVPMVATADHEGVIVADAVAEWAGRHGRAYELVLTGPAGGTWQDGTGGEQIEMPAFEFCRAVTGRAPAPGLLATQVPF